MTIKYVANNDPLFAETICKALCEGQNLTFEVYYPIWDNLTPTEKLAAEYFAIGVLNHSGCKHTEQRYADSWAVNKMGVENYTRSLKGIFKQKTKIMPEMADYCKVKLLARIGSILACDINNLQMVS